MREPSFFLHIVLQLAGEFDLTFVLDILDKLDGQPHVRGGR